MGLVKKFGGPLPPSRRRTFSRFPLDSWTIRFVENGNRTRTIGFTKGSEAYSEIRATVAGRHSAPFLPPNPYPPTVMYMDFRSEIP